jgi:hypothetical protein
MQRVLALGKLTPRLLEVFEAAEHETISVRVQALGIRKWTPPLVGGGHKGWLGQRPPLW